MKPVWLQYGILFILPLLTGCTTINAWLADLQKQPVDDFDKRSVYFRPQFKLEKPQREDLNAQEKRIVGAPPPEEGMIILDGTRYYSANGHVCQYFKHNRKNAANTPQPACFIGGKWVKAAPVLNTQVAP